MQRSTAFARDDKDVIVLITPSALHEPQLKGVIRTTGVGKYPRSGRTPAQKRLLAERAAKVIAYRNLLRATNQLEPVIINKGTLYVDGFLKGAEIVQKRYMSNGTVEVDMRLNVNLKGGGEHHSNVEIIEKEIEKCGYSAGVVSDEQHPVTASDIE